LSEETGKRRRRRAAARQSAEPVPEENDMAAVPKDIGTVPEARVPRPRRSAASRVFYSLFVILALAGLLTAILAAFGYQQYIEAGPLTAPKVVEVRKGLRTPDIAADLEEAGVISDATLFTAAAFLTGSRARLRAGEYEFAPGMSMRDVLGQIVQGKSIVYKLTIPEGWTTEQALDRIRDNEVLSGELTLTPPEGGLFPDTYLFKRGAARDSVVRQMMDAQQKLVNELWEKRSSDVAVKSVNEAVTLASIVEKETGLPEERARVAAVFSNRLKQRMRLQSDPTIIYGLVGGKGKLDRPLSKQDIALKTPYNTYRIDGLPPGPIANPGRAALEAVLKPPVTTDLYFVADGSGGHAFAGTLADHRKNVAKWREIERQRNSGEAEFFDELAAEKAGEPAPSSASKPADAEQTQAATSRIPAPPIPEGTAGPAAGGGEQKVVTPELPAVEDQSAVNAKNTEMASQGPKSADAVTASKPAAVQPTEPPPSQPQGQSQAAAEPPQPQTAAEPVPQPEVEIEKPPEPLPEPPADSQAAAVPPALPDSSSKKTAAAAAAAVAETIPLPRVKPRLPPKPGDLIKIANRLVPIPVPKPAAH
jgi:peptidoglycan lytic transglycosylase G